MIRSFRSKGLAELWSANSTRKIDSKMHKRMLVRLDRLNVASTSKELDLPGFDFHALKGHKAVRYSIRVNSPWCLTFEFEKGDAHRVDFRAVPLVEQTMEYPADRSPDRCPTHPGELLREVVIPATGRSKAEIASLLGISRQHLYDILRERKPVSPNVAVRLGKLFGDGADVWVRTQAAYDTWHAAREVDLSRIPTLVAA